MIKAVETSWAKVGLRTAKQLMTEAAAGGVLSEKVFLEILQNSQENTCVRVSFLIKLNVLPEKWDRDPGVGPRTQVLQIY